MIPFLDASPGLGLLAFPPIHSQMKPLPQNLEGETSLVKESSVRPESQTEAAHLIPLKGNICIFT